MLNILLKFFSKQSCEDVNTRYVCIGKRRYIFRDGKYVGWYKP